MIHPLKRLMIILIKYSRILLIIIMFWLGIVNSDGLFFHARFFFFSFENIVTKIIQDDVVHEDSEDIVNMLNDYVVDIVRNIADSIGGNNGDHLDYTTRINQPNSLLFH